LRGGWVVVGGGEAATNHHPTKNYERLVISTEGRNLESLPDIIEKL